MDENNYKTVEYCPHCDTEVELEPELKVQTCPNCGMKIVTCSMCRACYANDDKKYCSNCCLSYEAKRENEEENLSPKPKIVKRKYRFWSQHWVDIEVEGTEEECAEIAKYKYNIGDYTNESYEDTDMEDITDR